MKRTNASKAGFKAGVSLREAGPGINVIKEIDSLWPPAVLSRIRGGKKFSKYNRSGTLPARGSKIRKEMEKFWTAYGNGVIDGYHASARVRSRF